MTLTNKVILPDIWEVNVTHCLQGRICIVSLTIFKQVIKMMLNGEHY